MFVKFGKMSTFSRSAGWLKIEWLICHVCVKKSCDSIGRGGNSFMKQFLDNMLCIFDSLNNYFNYLIVCKLWLLLNIWFCNFCFGGRKNRPGEQAKRPTRMFNPLSPRVLDPGNNPGGGPQDPQLYYGILGLFYAP